LISLVVDGIVVAVEMERGTPTWLPRQSTRPCTTSPATIR
jgi:hypothetical protein